MTHYLVFLKKEIFENIRTYKMIVLLLIFFIFGVLNPLMAKMTPDILNSIAPEMALNLPEPSAYDSWTQFFKNIGQTGLIAVVIVYSGVLCSELSRGTLVNMLTKGLSRSAVILSKFTCIAVVWTGCLKISFFVTYGYTVYLFPDDKVYNLLFSVLCMWLYGVFLLAVIIFVSTLVKNNYACLLITGGVVVFLSIISIVPKILAVNPLYLATKNLELMTETANISDAYVPIILTVLITVALMVFSVLIFKKKQL